MLVTPLAASINSDKDIILCEFDPGVSKPGTKNHVREKENYCDYEFFASYAVSLWSELRTKWMVLENFLPSFKFQMIRCLGNAMEKK